MEALTNQKNEIITSFNTIGMYMINYLSGKSPKSFFGCNQSFIETFFKHRPREGIALFIQNVYSNDEYRTSIKNGDDTFFLHESFNEAKSEGYESKIFEFKDLWKNLDEDSKSLIKESMQMLIEHAETYIGVVAQINKNKK